MSSQSGRKHRVSSTDGVPVGVAVLGPGNGTRVVVVEGVGTDVLGPGFVGAFV
eukprot:CAMPEP_0171039146 /NCGR_PEP_ID=MMETSP0736-20130129/43762_1 /TAXON_ID=186038 /ORGANISM="Fragilariopsis kerguelensis, Strain L26-C5" /LENGTH=52 /DNA_ID=CAMNT_0011485933 /DNA_START=26 /DNA_END=180 /DNA_ORIENTATION=-